ncbi:signal protein [Streptomyces sp. HYC2]|uniref:signal protein n=1 Tax=Streptomyces sp. HYC2 TaxID=2955207 RepID=UPI00247FC592|nr:signal protein [Streptomyces sp. HYC2]
MKIRAVAAALTAVMLAVLVGCGTRAQAQDRLSSKTLQSRWWTWALSEPESTNPVADQDGSACKRNQPRDVWFLAGTFGTQAERTCNVPHGVRLAFPLVNLIGRPVDCAVFMSAAEGSAVLDGRELEVDTHPGETISARSVAGNPFTSTRGHFTTTGCGLWGQVPPLGPGKHTLTIRGRSGDFSVSVNYTLTVDAA